MLELYGSTGCPYTAELREQLMWQRRQFVEYDVEHDAQALQRLVALTDGIAGVPVLVEDGAVTAIGWEGRTCYVKPP